MDELASQEGDVFHNVVPMQLNVYDEANHMDELASQECDVAHNVVPMQLNVYDEANGWQNDLKLQQGNDTALWLLNELNEACDDMDQCDGTLE